MKLSKYKKTLQNKRQAEELRQLLCRAEKRASLSSVRLSAEGKSVQLMRPEQLVLFRKLQGFGWTWNCHQETVVEVYDQKQEGIFIRIKINGEYKRFNKSIKN